MRITAGVLRLESDDPQQLADPIAPARRRHDVMERERLRQDVADRHPRIERGVRILEDQLGVAAERPHVALTHRDDITSGKPHATRGWLDQAQHEAPDRRFATAGFAD